MRCRPTLREAEEGRLEAGGGTSGLRVSNWLHCPHRRPSPLLAGRVNITPPTPASWGSPPKIPSTTELFWCAPLNDFTTTSGTFSFYPEPRSLSTLTFLLSLSLFRIPKPNTIRIAKGHIQQDAGSGGGDEYVPAQPPQYLPPLLQTWSSKQLPPSIRADLNATDTNSGERQTGRKAQLSNIAAAKTYVAVEDPPVACPAS